MNHQFLVSVMCASMLLVSMAGCRSDEPLLTDLNVNAGKGRVVLNLDLDTSPMRGPRAAAARDLAEEVTTDSLTITLTHNLYDIDPTVFNPGEYSDTTQYITGPYTVEAMYGDPEAEGWDMPRYYGSQDIVIENQSTTTVDLPVTMDNARLTLDFSDAFNNYLSDCVVSVTTASGETFDWSEAEGRDLYVNPGEISLTVEFTKPSGLTGEFSTGLEAESRHAYTIVIDADFQSESLQLSFDDSFEEKKIDVDISDANLPNLEAAPMVLCDGFTSGQTFTCIESFRPDTPLKATISARSGIQSVVLNTTSASLLSQHWPATVDLTSPGIAEAIINKLGLKTIGLDAGKDVFAVIDFTDIIPNIAYIDGADNTTTFTLVVTDKRGRTLERQLFTYSFEKLTLELLPESVMTGNGQATLSIHYNGADAKNLRVEAKNPFGIYEELSCLPTLSGDNVYTFNVQGCDLINYTSVPVVRAKVGNYTSDDFSLKIPAVYVAQTNTFATHAYATVLFTDDAASARKSDVTFEASADGGNSFSAVTSEPVEATRSRAAGEQAVYHITGLTHNTPYIIRARLDDEVSVSTGLTTEEARQLPNGDMEQWDIVPGDVQYWWRTYCGDNAANTPWGTLNLVSTSQGGSDTGNLSTKKNGMGYCAASGTDRTTEKNSGQYAALIKTVGWGSGNTAGGNTSSVKHMTVGSLHLGSSPTQYVDIDPESYDSSIDYGYEFSSRPESMTFMYKYLPNNSADYGYVEIWIKDASDNILAKNTEHLTAQSSYTEKTLSLSYETAAKAKKICVIFRSSANRDCQSINNKNLSYPAFAASKDTQTVGSQLFIDDIKLNY